MRRLAIVNAKDAAEAKRRPRRESDLHKLIAAECGRRALVVFHGRMDRRSGRTVGEPDLTICLPQGRVLFVECKTPSGRLSEDQCTVRARMGLLGHRVHVVTDFLQFHQILTAELRAGAFARETINSKPTNESSNEAQNRDLPRV